MRSVGASLHGCRAPGSRGTRDGPQHHGRAGREPALDPSQPMSPACALWTTSLHVSQELEELWAAPQTHGRNPVCAALHGTLRTPAWGGPSLHRSRPFHSLPVGPLPSVLWRVLRDPAGTPRHAWERPSSLTMEPRKAWKAIGRRRCPSERSPLLRFILCLGGWERAGLFSILVW